MLTALLWVAAVWLVGFIIGFCIIRKHELQESRWWILAAILWFIILGFGMWAWFELTYQTRKASKLTQLNVAVH